jgi:predicted nucleotidyltransferase
VRELDLSRLGDYLSQRADIVFAVAFGSARDGKVAPESDLDVGVFFRERPQSEELFSLLTHMADVLDFDRIDFTDLGRADAILGFEAIAGRFLCKNDVNETARIVSLICREYEDAMVDLNRAA